MSYLPMNFAAEACFPYDPRPNLMPIWTAQPSCERSDSSWTWWISVANGRPTEWLDVWHSPTTGIWGCAHSVRVEALPSPPPGLPSDLFHTTIPNLKAADRNDALTKAALHYQGLAA